MNKDLRVYLDHIIKSIEHIEQYIQGMDEEEFLETSWAIDAVDHRLTVIGEAMRRIPKSFQDRHRSIEWHKAIATRNVIIHEYDRIEREIIWDVITNDLPRMKSKLKVLLKKMDSENLLE